jgi:SET domain-containing protein
MYVGEKCEKKRKKKKKKEFNMNIISGRRKIKNTSIDLDVSTRQKKTYTNPCNTVRNFRPRKGDGNWKDFR